MMMFLVRLYAPQDLGYPLTDGLKTGSLWNTLIYGMGDLVMLDVFRLIVTADLRD